MRTLDKPSLAAIERARSYSKPPLIVVGSDESVAVYHGAVTDSVPTVSTPGWMVTSPLSAGGGAVVGVDDVTVALPGVVVAVVVDGALDA